MSLLAQESCTWKCEDDVEARCPQDWGKEALSAVQQHQHQPCSKPTFSARILIWLANVVLNAMSTPPPLGTKDRLQITFPPALDTKLLFTAAIL